MGTDDSRSEGSWGVGQAGMEGRAGGYVVCVE